MTTMSDTATEALAAFDERIRAAKKRHSDLTAERNTARRKVSAAEAEFQAYQEAVGAGEVEDDPGEVARLEAAIAEAERGAAERVWMPKIGGASRGVDAAQQARDQFAWERFSDLAAEQAVLDPEVRERLQAAYEELESAESAYAARLRVWHSLRDAGGLTAEDIPGLPTRGADDEVRARFAEGIEAPTPRPLLK